LDHGQPPYDQSTCPPPGTVPALLTIAAPVRKVVDDADAMANAPNSSLTFVFVDVAYSWTQPTLKVEVAAFV